MMPAKPGTGFKIWTTVLSVFVAVMLFPAIVGKRGVAMSLVITALAVGVIWAMYFFIGRIINGAVAKELKRRSERTDARDRDAGPGPTGG
jgi:membrane-anchored glycerophosphoryl diester phosphodiesterase (GDPDase)